MAIDEHTKATNGQSRMKGIQKSPTGIYGLDEITEGGLPTGRPTLVCGNAGCGKTLLGMEFLIRGVQDFNEPGVFMAFEETEHDLTQNVRSLGFDLKQMQADGRLVVDHVHVDRSQIDEAGEYDLEGLFIRLGLAIDSVGAKRVVLDTLESLFAGFDNTAVLRAELRRLFLWLKERNVTAVITAERGDGQLTRQGLEEYVSDCVIVLDHRVSEQVSTRRMRIVKYRGTTHGTNEYPFLIGDRGINVLPITALGLDHIASNDRVSTGVAKLDQMLGGKGFFRGSSVLVSGTAGTGKTSLAGHFADATCRTGERCLYYSFEESSSQILRNLLSVGLDLKPWIKSGMLQFHTSRPTLYGLETHLALMLRTIEEFKPSAVIVDPVSNFVTSGSNRESQLMLVRLIDALKLRNCTAFMVNLVSGNESAEQTEIDISSLVDTWILLRDIELGGERNRGIYILKSRGMAHSNQIREFVLTERGVDLLDVYVGPEGVLTGSMRVAQEARELEEAQKRARAFELNERQMQRRRQAILAQIASLEADLASEEADAQELASDEVERRQRWEESRKRISHSRKVQ